MRTRIDVVTLVKVVIALVAMSLLIGIPARGVAPTLSYLALVGLVLLGLAVLLGVTLATLYVSQFVLRHGGTDTQWFGFPGEPPGLKKLREEQKEEDERRES